MAIRQYSKCEKIRFKGKIIGILMSMGISGS